MNAHSAIYWIPSIITAVVFLSGGTVCLLGVDEPLRGMAALGYPAFSLTFLGIWKILGGIAILAPGFGRLKEWAWAGIAFDLTGAALATSVQTGTRVVGGPSLGDAEGLPKRSACPSFSKPGGGGTRIGWRRAPR